MDAGRHRLRNALSQWYSNKGSLVPIAGGTSAVPVPSSRLFGSNLMTVSLDKAVLPFGSAKAQRLSQAGLLVCVAVMTVTVMDYLYNSRLGEWIEEKLEETQLSDRIKDMVAKTNFGFVSTILNKLSLDIFPLFQLSLRVVWAKCVSVAESLKGYIENAFDLNPAEEVDIKDWKVCMLSEREALPGNYMRYRFELTNPLGVLPLYIGQEVRFFSCSLVNFFSTQKNTHSFIHHLFFLFSSFLHVCLTFLSFVGPHLTSQSPPERFK